MVAEPGKSGEPSAVEICLAEARRDLDNAEFHLGFLFNPLRKFILAPLFDIEAKILPPIAKTVPPLDALLSFGLGIAFGVARDVYHVTHSEWFVESRKELDEMFDPRTARELRFQLSDARAGLGFHIHSVVEFLSHPAHDLGVWKDYTDRLASYCRSVGIEDELLRPILEDPFAVNSRILGAVQRDRESTEARRMKTAMTGDPEVHSAATVAKMMRYSCAAYGRPIMDGYDIIMGRYKTQQPSELLDNWIGGDSLKGQVADHVGIPADWITHFYLGAGGDLDTLRYYISADHDLRAVVLVIRGTFSITQWAIDFQGQSKEFCGGEAHSGIADLAVAIVEKARPELIEVLRENPGYKLMITGQSLGGGLSPLVNILLHEDPDIGYRNIECHAFAGPPVYYSESVPPTVAKAVANCTHYVHGDDIVPYLGLHQVRRTIAQLHALEKRTREIGFLPSILSAMGRAPIREELIDAALFGDANLPTVAGGPKLIMPARQNVWFVYDDRRDEVNFTVCDPKDFSTLPIYLAGASGIQHHVPQSYEYVLNKAEKHGWRKILR